LSQIKPADFFGSSFSSNNKKFGSSLSQADARQTLAERSRERSPNTRRTLAKDGHTLAERSPNVPQIKNAKCSPNALRMLAKRSPNARQMLAKCLP
jgi:hypothetical protein